MEKRIYAGQQVLYKIGGKGTWRTGVLMAGGANLTKDGLTFMVGDIENDNLEEVKPDNIFFDSHELDDWMKDDDILYSKEEFAQHIEDGDFVDCEGDAFMSDGEYYYYNVPRLNANWIRKQSLDYVVWFHR